MQTTLGATGKRTWITNANDPNTAAPSTLADAACDIADLHNIILAGRPPAPLQATPSPS
ncbi:hypothetical protein [Micromonospora sp. NPDC049274]|uniref:hypothetical protein n=1 Tax=Micromonospora sp. NPDC049274 TaxID=3154829 RepID=UPI003433D5E7